ncbi:PREDICTED: protein lethal(2)essential for life-like [Dufourea novaeangliae]|uniref:Protein lethal(2)essential for life n=1 Tax=Dufourea novaeangliae TaxID=178035 RepID=A0A154PDR5_DUFNO|nr:PREDICTED: protein lethal(2)essential for life-like [Dufourea novaeangliae]KZC10002.1 Protein lethal(2)essential for life [Dufourea novaeangliae]
MSAIPLLFSDWWEDLDHPHRLLDQNFGLGLYPDQLLMQCPLRLPSRRGGSYVRPWTELVRSGEEAAGSSTVEADKDKFQVVLDVQQFEPNEIDVKVVDRFVVVTAKHEEKRDEHGWVSRQFMRKYLIPEQCDIDQVSSKLSLDGLLTINAPRKAQPKAENERVIKITFTGKPAIQGRAQQTKQEKQQGEKENKEEKK